MSKRHLVEHWYNLSSATVGKAGKESKCDQPLLRVKARYQTVHILPMDLYQDLIDVSIIPAYVCMCVGSVGCKIIVEVF